jgi:hypothetical protein
MDKHTKRSDSERGQSLVEFSMTLIFILILLAGIVDLGRAFFAYIAVRDSAQEGASYASFCMFDSTGTLNNAAIEVRVRSSSSIPIDLSDTSNVAVSQVCSSGGSTIACSATAIGDSINISVSYTGFTVSMPFIGAFIDQNLTIEANVDDTILTVDDCSA